MGLGIAIAGSISVAAVFLVMAIIPGATDKFVESMDAKTEINNLEKKISKTDFRLSQLTGESGSEIFSFTLTNTGTEKLWNYDRFDFLVTYDADVLGTKTRLNESFSYNKTASFSGISETEIARPDSDESVGGWTSTPLFSKLNEVSRDDNNFITSPLIPTTPANDVEVGLESVTDPQSAGGHRLSYTYKVTNLPVTDGMLGYGDIDIGPTYPVKHRLWNGTSFLGEVAAGIPQDTGVRWVVLRTSPISNEKIMGVLVDNGITKTLYIQTWNGISWTANWNKIVLSDNARLFDIAYEENSGDVIVVYGDGLTSQLFHRKRVGGTWDSTDQLAGNALTAAPNWVVAKPRPTNSDIFVAVGTTGSTLAALRWDGSTDSFVSGDQLTGIAIATAGQRVFDIGFEGESGDAFLLYGFSQGSTRELRYREYTTSWGTTQTAYSGFPQAPNWVNADYERSSTSSKIAVAVKTNNALEFGVWNGNSWEVRPASSSVSGPNIRNFDVTFEKGSGRVMYAYALSSSPTQLSWRTWDSSTGFSSETTEAGIAGTIQFMQMVPDPFTKKIMVVYNDGNADLFHRLWSGASWSSLGSALEQNLPSTSARQPFMFSWDRTPIINLVVQLREGTSTVRAQWNEGVINEETNFVQRDRTLTAAQANSILNYADLRVRYLTTGGQIDWSWAEFRILYFNADTNEWIISSINGDEFDPRVINPGESTIMAGKLQYPIYPNGLLKVTITADNGKSATTSTIVT